MPLCLPRHRHCAATCHYSQYPSMQFSRDNFRNSSRLIHGLSAGPIRQLIPWPSYCASFRSRTPSQDYHNIQMRMRERSLRHHGCSSHMVNHPGRPGSTNLHWPFPAIIKLRNWNVGIKSVGVQPERLATARLRGCLGYP